MQARFEPYKHIIITLPDSTTNVFLTIPPKQGVSSGSTCMPLHAFLTIPGLNLRAAASQNTHGSGLFRHPDKRRSDLTKNIAQHWRSKVVRNQHHVRNADGTYLTDLTQAFLQDGVKFPTDLGKKLGWTIHSII